MPAIHELFPRGTGSPLRLFSLYRRPVRASVFIFSEYLFIEKNTDSAIFPNPKKEKIHSRKNGKTPQFFAVFAEKSPLRVR